MPLTLPTADVSRCNPQRMCCGLSVVSVQKKIATCTAGKGVLDTEASLSKGTKAGNHKGHKENIK